MHTSVILSEALKYFIDSEHFELSVVLFAVVVERLMKQRLCELDDVLVLDKSNSAEHLIIFKKLQNKLLNLGEKKSLKDKKQNWDTFRTITIDDLIRRYEIIFNLGFSELDDDGNPIEDRNKLDEIRKGRKKRAASIKRLFNMRNNIAHYFEYYFNPVDEGLFILNEILPFIREMIQEISDADKYNDIFNDVVIDKLKTKEEELTKQQSDTLSRKIREKKEEYNELNPEEIENRKKNACSSYDKKEIMRDSMNCPACENALFCILKHFSESEDEQDSEFITIGECSVCELELSEDELKTAGLLT